MAVFTILRMPLAVKFIKAEKIIENTGY